MEWALAVFPHSRSFPAVYRFIISAQNVRRRSFGNQALSLFVTRRIECITARLEMWLRLKSSSTRQAKNRLLFKLSIFALALEATDAEFFYKSHRNVA